jgi:type I restriction enzyme S subunit
MSIDETQELPAGWKWQKLGDICDQGRQMIDPSSDRAKRLPYLSLEHIESHTGRISRDPLEKVEDEGKSTTFLFDSRHVLYGKLRPYLNKVALPEFKGRCTTEAIPLIPRDNTDRLFLAWLLRREETVAAAMAEKTGSRMPRANMDDLLKLEVPTPPLPEQKRIAAILTNQMAAVEKARTAAEEQLNAAKKLPVAYLQEAFPDVIPLSAEHTKQPAPAGWRWILLTDIARLESGHTPSRYKPEWWGGDIPWLALPDIRNLDGKIATDTSEYTNEEGIANSSARILPAGTVCLSRTASVGFVTLMGREMSTSQDFVNWVCSDQLNPHFLMYILQASRDYFRSLSEGAIHKTVYMPTVKAFSVCIPSVSEQKRIADLLRKKLSIAESLCTKIAIELETIKSLPSALLRKAFQGEL